MQFPPSSQAQKESGLTGMSTGDFLVDSPIPNETMRLRNAAFTPEAWLPPLLSWTGASESLIAEADDPWITPAEVTGLKDSPSYDATMTWLARLCQVSNGLLSMVRFGYSAQQRPLFLVVAAQPGSHFPEGLRNSGRPTLLVQAGIHPGEIEGKDAGLMLLRDILSGNCRSLVDHANLLFIPILNPDGHERSSIWNRPNQRGPHSMGWRTTAQNLNLNRDYMKVEAPEMRAFLRMFHHWPVDLYLDVHSTDGLDYQYDFTYAYHGREGTPSWSPAISRWLDRSFSPVIDAALLANGHLPLNFYVTPVDKKDLTLGLREHQMLPRYSLGYGDLCHVPTVLVETHSLKPYRQRVLATRVFLEAALAHIAAECRTLRSVIKADRDSRPEQLVRSWARSDTGRKIDFLGIDFQTYDSTASGSQEVRWLGRPRIFRKLPIFPDQAGHIIRRPEAYWVPVWKTDVIDKLRVHGISFEILDHTVTIDVTMYRIECESIGSGSAPEEARFPVKATSVQSEFRLETFPAGSVRVPTDQPLGNLVMMLLDPMSDDSLFRWGFFNEILHRTEYIESYVIAPLAEQMLATDPAMQEEFSCKLNSDPVFAANSTARLQWFYARTPFFDERYLLYPVGIT